MALRAALCCWQQQQQQGRTPLSAPAHGALYWLKVPQITVSWCSSPLWWQQQNGKQHVFSPSAVAESAACYGVWAPPTPSMKFSASWGLTPKKQSSLAICLIAAPPMSAELLVRIAQDVVGLQASRKESRTVARLIEPRCGVVQTTPGLCCLGPPFWPVLGAVSLSKRRPRLGDGPQFGHRGFWAPP